MKTMTNKKILSIIAAAVAIIPAAGTPEAFADTQNFETQSASAPFKTSENQSNTAFRSATGITPTAGDKGAAVQISVRGEHRYVQ